MPATEELASAFRGRLHGIRRAALMVESASMADSLLWRFRGSFQPRRICFYGGISWPRLGSYRKFPSHLFQELSDMPIFSSKDLGEVEARHLEPISGIQELRPLVGRLRTA